MKNLLLIAILGFYTYEATAQLIPKSSRKLKQVKQKVDEFNKAVFETKDSLKLDNLLHAKVTYGHSSGLLENKPMMIKKAIASPAVYENLSLEGLTMRFEKGAAIVRHNLRATSIENNLRSPLNLNILQVWLKQKGGWKLIARQAVKIAPKE